MKWNFSLFGLEGNFYLHLFCFDYAVKKKLVAQFIFFKIVCAWLMDITGKIEILWSLTC